MHIDLCENFASLILSFSVEFINHERNMYAYNE